jgi:hypothetical protein
MTPSSEMRGSLPMLYLTRGVLEYRDFAAKGKIMAVIDPTA